MSDWLIDVMNGEVVLLFVCVRLSLHVKYCKCWYSALNADEE